MLDDEVRIVLNNIETEFLSIVKFVNDLESNHRENVPPAEKNNQSNGEISPNESFPKETSLSRTALADAFNLVKSVLVRISNLIDQFSSLTTSRECTLPNDSSYLENYYYTQYVHHIAFYLTKIVETNISDFSERLDTLASSQPPERAHLQFSKRKKSPKAEETTKSEYQDDHTNLQRKESPKSLYTDNGFKFAPLKRTHEKFKFDYFKPATVFERDGSRYTHIQVKNDKSGLRPSPHTHPNLLIYCLNEDALKEEDDRNKLKQQLKSRDCCQTEERTNEIFLQITKSLNSLLIIVQNLLDTIKERTNSSSTQLPKHASHKSKPLKKRIIRQRHSRHCCSTTCKECCAACRHLHEKSGSKIHESFWCNQMLPTLHKEPLWMQVNPWDKREKNKVENKLQCVDEIIAKSSKSWGKREKMSSEILKRESSTLCFEVKAPNINNKLVDRTTSTAKESENSTSDDSESSFASVLSRQNVLCPLKYCSSDIPAVIRNRELISRGTSKPRLPKSEQKSNVIHENIKNEPRKKIIGHNASTSTNPEHETAEEMEDAKSRKKVSSGKKSTFNWDIKEIINYTLGGFILSPKKTSSSGAKEDTTELSDKRDYAYPKSIVFKVTEFSNLLKEKLRDHFARSSDLSEEAESTLIIDMIINCLQESTDFQHKNDAGAEKYTNSESETSLIDPNVTNDHTQTADFKIDTKIGTKLQGVKTEDSIDNVKRRSVSQACTDCLKIKLTSESEGLFDKQNIQEKATCFTCWNAWQRGLAIHQCHDVLPSDILEIRHMDSRGNICVCFQKWNKNKESKDWRWLKNPFYNPTRIEISELTSSSTNPVLKVIYGAEGMPVKQSLATTQLQTIQTFDSMEIMPTSLRDRSKSLPKTLMEQRSSASITSLNKKPHKPPVINAMFHKENTINTKLGNFFDDIQKVGYGKGPPLVIKVRRKTAVHDAYDLLMAPSNIRLHYYRRLRTLFVSDEKADQPTSSTNFEEEDESDELFEILERSLFSSGGKQIFEYPSEETPFLYLNPDSQAHPQWFTFAGVVLALALIHQKKMNVRIAHVLYKCLLNRQLRIQDLQEIDPLFYQKLMWIKEHSITDRKVKMTFVLREKIGEKVRHTELLPNGANIAVTEDNKYRYIDLALKWKLAERSLTQLKDFRSGFVSVLEPSFLSLFNVKELQAIIRHPPNKELFFVENENVSDRKSACDIPRRGTCEI